MRSDSIKLETPILYVDVAVFNFTIYHSWLQFQPLSGSRFKGHSSVVELLGQVIRVQSQQAVKKGRLQGRIKQLNLGFHLPKLGSIGNTLNLDV